jgi:hypothetical protein
VIIGPPGTVGYSGHPDIAIVGLMDPASVVGQFRLVFVEFGGQIIATDALAVKRLPGAVPVGERLIENSTGWLTVGSAARGEIAFCGMKHLAAGDYSGARLSSGLHLPFQGKDHRFIISDIHPVKSLLEDVEGGIRRMNFYLFFNGQVVDAQVGWTAEKVNADQVIPAFGEALKINLRIGSQPKKIIAAEVDLHTAVPGPELLSLNDGKVYDAFLITQVSGPLDENISLDIAEMCIAPGIIILLAGAEKERKTDHQECHPDNCSFHCLTHSFLLSTW